MGEEECGECSQCQRDGKRPFQRGARDPDERSEEQREAHRTEAPEDAEYLWTLAEADIDPAQRGERNETGNDEEEAGERAREMASLLVPDVDGKLQRLRAGQDVAEVERADELLLVDPLLPLDALQVHEPDLAPRSAKREPSELEEVPEDLAHRDLTLCRD